MDGEARQEGHPRRCTFAFKPGLVWVEQLGSDREDMGAASSREAFALDFGMDVADDGFRADPVRSRRSGLRLLCLPLEERRRRVDARPPSG